MSLTFTLTDKSSNLNSRINPPIEVNESATLALIGFDTFNSIPNVNNNNNTVHFILNGGEHSFQIPVGAYEIEDIEKNIQKLFKIKLDQVDSNTIHGENDGIFSLTCNKNTLKCIARTSYDLDFSKPNSIGQLLGFTSILKADKEYVSENIVNITNINTIRIECNLITGAYINGKLSHTIYEFYPCVPPGYKILENPTNTIYLPLNKRLIDEINIQIVDQDGKSVSFMNETVTVRLHLKNK